VTSTSQDSLSVFLEIGGVSFNITTSSASFFHLLCDRYSAFLRPTGRPDITWQINLHRPSEQDSPEEDLQVTQRYHKWVFQRGDFLANWDAESGLGQVSQSASAYALDSVIRIALSIFLASRGGLLIHSASAIRQGHAYLFAGVSGAGKTTISRLAPVDTTLLSDEISLVRVADHGVYSFGTPFSGELATSGENQSAPIGAIYLLEKGLRNEIVPVAKADAVQALLRHVLFFSEDRTLVGLVFDTVCAVINQAPVHRLIFVPDHHVWEIIGTGSEVYT